MIHVMLTFLHPHQQKVGWRGNTIKFRMGIARDGQFICDFGGYCRRSSQYMSKLDKPSCYLNLMICT